MPNRELFRKWFEYAEMDYNVAVHDKSFHPVPIEIICYHCQQAGEKAIKAVLAYYDETIPHIHDIYRLLEACKVHVPELVSLASETKKLTDYAAITRYPNDIELEIIDMNQALEYAGKILEKVKDIINPIDFIPEGKVPNGGSN